MKLHELHHISGPLLMEGGKATAEHGTKRAGKQDVELALAFVAKTLGVDVKTLEGNLLGSSRNTLAGTKQDSGDVDIAFPDKNRDAIISKMKAATADPYKIGNNTFSFPVPTHSNRKVQVDIMFVPSEKWARWMYHSAADSKHKGKIRNALLRAVVANTVKKEEDLIVNDSDGNMIIRVRKSLKNGEGIVRLFKVAKLRKNGKGRVKSMSDATPEEVQQALSELGVKEKFSPNRDQILDPDQAAAYMFGAGTKAEDIKSTEQVVQKILKLKNAKDIVNSAIGNEMTVKEVPQELQHLITDDSA